MCAGTGQIEIVTVYAVNQKPVALYMALLEAAPVTRQPMILIYWREWSRDSQGINDSGKQPHVIASLDTETAIFLEC